MKPFEQLDFENFMQSFEKPRFGISTGLSSLDKVLLGFQLGRLYVVGGVSSSGKSSIIADFVLSAAQEVPIGIISIEMGRELFIERLVFNKANINYHKANSGLLDHQEKQDLARATVDINKMNIIAIDAEALSIYPTWMKKKWAESNNDPPDDDIEYTIESWAEQGCKIIFIDYLQLAELAEKKEREDLKVKEISRRLKLLTTKLNISIVLVVQLTKNVDTRDNPEPEVSDIWGSGFIRNDADVILLLYRPDLGKKFEADLFENSREEAFLLIKKNRNGPLAKIPVYYQPYNMSYRDKEETSDEELF